MKQLCHYISEYMGVLVLAAAVLALAFPSVLQQVPTKVINYLLGVVMFGMGLTLNLKDFKIVFSRPKDVIVGCLAQFTIMPLLAWGLAKAFQLDEALALGVVLVGCCPGGTASNVITYLAKGDLALSVGMTGVSTLLAPLLTPMLTWALAGKSVDVDVAGMLQSILWVVIVPIVVGLIVKALWPKFTEKATDYLPAFSSVAIALIVAIIIAANASKLLAGGLVIVIVVILHNICGLGLGYLIGWLLELDEPKKRAVSIEVGMQNSGLASSLATLHFAAYPLATIPGAIFSVWHNISGAIVARVYARTDKLKINKIMRQKLYLIIFIAIAAILMVGCTGNGKDTVNSREPQASDTLYTQQAAMAVYGYQPERALQIIDSAVIVGNLSQVRADVERARIYSMTQVKPRLDSLLHGPAGTSLDSGRVIGERVLAHDSLKQDLNLRQQLLEILVYTARMQQDTLTWMQRSRELIEVCHQQHLEIEALRTEAELGAALCNMGQQEKGMAMLDSVIAALSEKLRVKSEEFAAAVPSADKGAAPCPVGNSSLFTLHSSFNTLDAFIIASKRKIGVLSSTGRYVETLPLARRIIERLEDYEAHPDQYADDTKRVSSDSASRADYINYYRTQAQGYISAAYTALGQYDNMTDAYLQIERSVKEVTAREHIARYNALQQQMEAERQQMEAERQRARAERSQLTTLIFAILFVAALAALVWYWWQKRIISRKNRVLVKQMKEIDCLMSKEQVPATPLPVSEEQGSEDSLYNHLREVILAEQLYLDPQFGRQTIIERFQLSKERIGAVFSMGSDHSSLTDFVNSCRLDHARQLLADATLSIDAVAQQSGFGTRQTFSRNFVRRYGLTPTEYRNQLISPVGA